MPGIEPAGLVLGAIPIFMLATEGFSKAVDVCKELKKKNTDQRILQFYNDVLAKL